MAARCSSEVRGARGLRVSRGHSETSRVECERATFPWKAVLGIDDDTASAGVCAGGVTIQPMDRPDMFESSSRTSVKSTHWAPRDRVEWTLRKLVVLKDMRVQYDGELVPPGRYIVSPGFNIAGHDGYLHFWPNRLFTNFPKRDSKDVDMGGLHSHAWCAVGLFLPAESHLKFRFFVGDAFSDFRQCYWGGGARVQQLWTPDAEEPPSLDNLKVGVEVVRNFRVAVPVRTPRLRRPAQDDGHTSNTPPERPPPLLPRGDASTAEVVAGLRSLRAAAGLSLPSPRFVSLRDLRRLQLGSGPRK